MKALDLQSELNALGIRFEAIGYVKAPAYPYGVYVDDLEVIQPDTPEGFRVVQHEITIEVYHPDYATLQANGKIVEAWLNGIPLNYRKRHTFIIDENHFCLTYSATYRTKERNVIT